MVSAIIHIHLLSRGWIFPIQFFLLICSSVLVAAFTLSFSSIFLLDVQNILVCSCLVFSCGILLFLQVTQL